MVHTGNIGGTVMFAGNQQTPLRRLQGWCRLSAGAGGNAGREEVVQIDILKGLSEVRRGAIKGLGDGRMPLLPRRKKELGEHDAGRARTRRSQLAIPPRATPANVAGPPRSSGRAHGTYRGWAAGGHRRSPPDGGRGLRRASASPSSSAGRAAARLSACS